jgi:glycosyltransferase involved in cell wall biosynthesis
MDAPNPSPLVSVIIPAYQASADIGEALDSVFGQTFTDFEVIVVNDGSPDTQDLNAAIAPYLSRLRYIEQPNRGAAAARNAALRAARGEYVAFLDADDVWRQELLEWQMRFLKARPGHVLVYADARIAGESVLAGRRFMEHAPSCGEPTLAALIEQRCTVLMSTVVARREAIVAAGMFDETVRVGQDFDLWLRLAAAGNRLGYQRVVLATRRVRRAGLSGDRANELTRAMQVLDRFGRRHELPSNERTLLRSRIQTLERRREVELGRQRLLEGNFDAARLHISASRSSTVRARAALIGLRVAPRLLRGIYRAMQMQRT